MGDTWSTAEIAAVMGCTLRQLQWWSEKGLLGKLSKIGNHKRRFDRAAAMRVSLIVNLRKCGLSLQRIRKAAKQLQNIPLVPCYLICYVMVSTNGKYATWSLNSSSITQDAINAQSPVIVARIGEELENL